MLFKDNSYTALMADFLSVVSKPMDSHNQPCFLVNDNLIFGDVIDQDDDRLRNTKIETGDSIFFLAVANVLEIRVKDLEKLPDDEQNQFEPVYVYLENVIVHSTSTNKNIHLKEFALRISSIDGITIGDPTPFAE